MSRQHFPQVSDDMNKYFFVHLHLIKDKEEIEELNENTGTVNNTLKQEKGGWPSRMVFFFLSFGKEATVGYLVLAKNVQIQIQLLKHFAEEYDHTLKMNIKNEFQHLFQFLLLFFLQ